MRNLINKKNLYLLVIFVICLLVIVIVPTYAKFGSSYTTEEDVVGMSLAFDLNISNIEEYEEITLFAGEIKQFNVEIANNASEIVYYGIWYRMVVPDKISDDIIVAKLEDSVVPTSGSIDVNGSTTISLVIINNSDLNVQINIGVASSFSGVNEIEYLGGKYLINDTYLISEKAIESYDTLYNVASIGDYVNYTGNNGCVGDSCNGQNANFEEDVNLGYCFNSDYNYTVAGWRVAYKDSDTVYLISAGAPECICTDSNGDLLDDCDYNSSTYETTIGIPKHIENLNNQALNYCNDMYVYGGECNNDSTWNMNEADFEHITDSILSTCQDVSSDECGKTSTLINNGGFYYLASSFSDIAYSYYWNPINEQMSGEYTKTLNGLRPVIRLSADILVSEGEGSSVSPYIITK